jgi:hypothetical protein
VSYAEATADHGRVWLCERDDAQRVPCRVCAQPVDRTCVNLHTGRPLEGQPAHALRIRDAAALVAGQLAGSAR